MNNKQCYVFVEPGDAIQEGDEVWDETRWVRWSSIMVGVTLDDTGLPCRRPVKEICIKPGNPIDLVLGNGRLVTVSQCVDGLLDITLNRRGGITCWKTHERNRPGSYHPLRVGTISFAERDDGD